MQIEWNILCQTDPGILFRIILYCINGMVQNDMFDFVAEYVYHLRQRMQSNKQGVHGHAEGERIYAYTGLVVCSKVNAQLEIHQKESVVPILL